MAERWQEMGYGVCNYTLARNMKSLNFNKKLIGLMPETQAYDLLAYWTAELPPLLRRRKQTGDFRCSPRGMVLIRLPYIRPD